MGVITDMDLNTDTMLTATGNDEIVDTVDIILNLQDELCEEIVLENIAEQLDSKLSEHIDRMNYITYYKEKYENITPEDEFYDKEYMLQSVSKVGNLVNEGFLKRYGVQLGDDLDYTTPSVYLEDLEALYEFLYTRQFDNMVSYVESALHKEKEKFIQKYGALMDTDEHAKDLFVIQGKKKFRNPDDVVILHFINDIIDDICNETESAYVLFNTIVNLDLFEEFNNKISEMLINYGNKIIIDNDSEAAKKYLYPFFDIETKAELRNQIWSDYLEECELDDDVK